MIARILLVSIIAAGVASTARANSTSDPQCVTQRIETVKKTNGKHVVLGRTRTCVSSSGTLTLHGTVTLPAGKYSVYYVSVASGAKLHTGLHSGRLAGGTQALGDTAALPRGYTRYAEAVVLAQGTKGCTSHTTQNVGPVLNTTCVVWARSYGSAYVAPKG